MRANSAVEPGIVHALNPPPLAIQWLVTATFWVAGGGRWKNRIRTATAATSPLASVVNVFEVSTVRHTAIRRMCPITTRQSVDRG
jgi:hypothetical protein